MTTKELELPKPAKTKDGRFQHPWTEEGRPNVFTFQISRFNCKDEPGVPSKEVFFLYEQNNFIIIIFFFTVD